MATPPDTRQNAAPPRTPLPALPPEFADLTPQPGDWLTLLYHGPDLTGDPLKETPS